MSLLPIVEKLATNVDWHVRLTGNKRTAKFKFMEELSKSRTRYTIMLHQDYMVDTIKMTEFDFKAMLGKCSRCCDINITLIAVSLLISKNK